MLINANIESYSCREGSAAVMSLIRYLPDNVTAEPRGAIQEAGSRGNYTG